MAKETDTYAFQDFASACEKPAVSDSATYPFWWRWSFRLVSIPCASSTQRGSYSISHPIGTSASTFAGTGAGASLSEVANAADATRGREGFGDNINQCAAGFWLWDRPFRADILDSSPARSPSPAGPSPASTNNRLDGGSERSFIAGCQFVSSYSKGHG